MATAEEMPRMSGRRKVEREEKGERRRGKSRMDIVVVDYGAAESGRVAGLVGNTELGVRRYVQCMESSPPAD